MRKLKIRRNTNGDSRVATKVPTFSEFNDSNFEHCANVKDMMLNFAKDIKRQGENHDWTKVIEPYRSIFYRDMCNAIEGRMKFEDGEWNKLHYATERHHLLRNVPDDVNLIDVIEMIADCVCAGMARSGEVRPLTDIRVLPITLKLVERFWEELKRCKNNPDYLLAKTYTKTTM